MLKVLAVWSHIDRFLLCVPWCLLSFLLCSPLRLCSVLLEMGPVRRWQMSGKMAIAAHSLYLIVLIHCANRFVSLFRWPLVITRRLYFMVKFDNFSPSNRHRYIVYIYMSMSMWHNRQSSHVRSISIWFKTLKMAHNTNKYNDEANKIAVAHRVRPFPLFPNIQNEMRNANAFLRHFNSFLWRLAFFFFFFSFLPFSRCIYIYIMHEMYVWPCVSSAHGTTEPGQCRNSSSGDFTT